VAPAALNREALKLLKDNLVFSKLFPTYQQTPTRWERTTCPFREAWVRIKRAWRALRVDTWEDI
jgi:hypothetical protein